MNQIKKHDLVAIDRYIIAIHKETKQQILLRKGQVGKVVMDFEEKKFLIDFTDKQGKKYATVTLSNEQLIPLLYSPTQLLAK